MCKCYPVDSLGENWLKRSNKGEKRRLSRGGKAYAIWWSVWLGERDERGAH